MKKTCFIFSSVALAIAVFFGCSQNEAQEYSVIQTSTPIEDYDHESVYTPTDTDPSQSQNDDTTVLGLVVKDKKYTFEGNDLVIVNIKNQTNVHYSITVVGSYLDANGNILQTESKTFEQFAAGYENYFIFSPNFSFDSLQYSISTQEYFGELYVKELSMHFTGYKEVLMHVQELIEQGDHERHPVIIAEFCHISNAEVDICPEGEWILFNDKDEIIAICPIGTWLYAENAGREEKNHFMIYYTTEDKLVWPEHLKGDFKAICSLKKITIEQP